ncbi:acyl-CoA dehydrogenase [Streptomyces armeniacus]|uniref:Acyl-CoA dehydrogenase n=1 Tax=Streptomyces armeniacus TaxID=83291 RepID=A0A345XJ68_9ACTN|nr:acyl-CoA dehydrogenase family protein [Streptomyces armeniacus]AXK31684.1 acyl-CoA dehydrogenase [Streptomyces armeniacus]
MPVVPGPTAVHDSPLVRAAGQLAAEARGQAAEWDRWGGLPDAVRKQAAEAGLLAADLPQEYGGQGAGWEEVGEACAHLGGVCSALRGLVTVQGMVAAAVRRWGTAGQRARWLPRFASGELTAAFAATEAEAGSALAGVRTEVRIPEEGDAGEQAADEGGPCVVVTGRKRWITFGECADVFLVLGQSRGRPVAVLVEGDREGVRRQPVSDQLGMRAARIAHVEFDAVSVPRSNLVAPPGAGLSHVAAIALDHGRYTVAWGCVGMAEACLADAVEHVSTRTQAGTQLSEHQLVRAQLARSAVQTAGARELAVRAARQRAAGTIGAAGVTETIVAKYAGAEAAASVSRDAVQLLGSAGCEPDSRAGRFFRDGKVMEIIEGAQHVAELHIAERLLREHRPPAGSTAQPVRPGPVESR